MANLDINRSTGSLATFAAASLDAPVAPPAQEQPKAAPATPQAAGDRNLSKGGLDVLRNAANGSEPVDGGPSVYTGGDLTQSAEYKLYEAEVALTLSKKALDAATVAAKAELAALSQLTSRLQFAQGGELDALAPDQRKKTFDQYLSRAQSSLGTNPPNVEAYRSYLNSALTVFNPTTEVQKRYYGPAVTGPEAGDALAKLRSLLKGSGYKGDAATNPNSLYALRGNAIEAQSKVDTLKNAAAQAQKIQLKAAEAETAQTEAVALRDRYQAVRTEALTEISSVEANTRAQITALMTQFANQPELVQTLNEALKLLAGAADAFRVSEYGQSKQFLDKLKQTLKAVPGLDLSRLDTMSQRVTQTQQVASQSWLANHKASRLAQEYERMRAGYLKAIA